jgi:hypothetical protein
MMIFTDRGFFVPSPTTTDKWLFGNKGFVLRSAGFVLTFINKSLRTYAWWE